MPKVIALKRRPSAHDRFGLLIEPHFDALYAAARRLTMSQHDAEDLVQEVCIKAFDRLDDLARVEFPRAWLLKVMYNHFVDDTRRSARSPVDAAWTGDESAEPDEIASSAKRPEEQVDQAQRIERVLRAMGYLDANQCALVAMHDVEGLSIDELCGLTGMPAGTIKSQLHRTRVKLGRLLRHKITDKPRLKIVGAQG